MNKVNLQSKFAKFTDHWHPRIVAELDDYLVKVAKLQGEFVWHTHEHEDELFLVMSGELLIKLPDEDITLSEGELFVVPKGIPHLPIAREEAKVLLLEHKSALHTGDVADERTVSKLEWI